MTEPMDWDRLARYVSGEAAGGERVEVERWAAASPENRAAFDAAMRRWTAAVEPAAWDVESAWNRLQPRLASAQSEGRVPATTRTARVNPWRLAFVPLAAAAVLLIAVVIRFGSDADDTTTVTSAPTEDVLRTGRGEQRSVNLPDGSHVVLGPESTLRVHPQFGVAAREVFLEGQAFIRVSHDPARPFVVNARGTRTVDLGTAFEVRAYPSEAVRVAVTEGAVEVRRQASGQAPVAVLQAGDVARLAGSSAVDIRRRQDVERLLGWTRGELAFDDTPLSEIADELERWFDVECRIGNPAIQDLHLTLHVRTGESLSEILKVVELALASHGVRTERDGRTVTFRRGPPVSPAMLRPAARAEVGG
ncbi:MAG TPA: FecR domain-containing protein [Gemmatimonadaceae bacterium]